MSFIKKVVSIFLFFFFLFFINTFVIAQTENNPNQITPPKILVKNIYLEKDLFIGNDIVVGSVILENKNDFAVNDISLIISLLGSNDKTTLNRYDDFGFSKQAELFSLRAGEVKFIKFEYQLPVKKPAQYIALGIKTISSDDIELGQLKQRINFEAEILSHIVAQGGKIIIDDDVLELSPIPLVYKDESAQFSYSIKNDSSQDIAVTPFFSIVEKNNPEKIIAKYEESQLFIKKGGQINVINNLKNFAEAGTYEGKINFIDDEGNSRGKAITFSYIIDGSLASIDSISTSENKISFGQYLNVSINYSGKPFDVRNPEISRLVKDVIIDVVVTNSKGKEILKKSLMTDLEENGKLDFELFSLHFANEFKVSASFFKDGEILAQKDLEISSQAEKDGILIPTILSIIGVLIVLFISFFILKRKYQKTI